MASNATPTRKTSDITIIEPLIFILMAGIVFLVMLSTLNAARQRNDAAMQARAAQSAQMQAEVEAEAKAVLGDAYIPPTPDETLDTTPESTATDIDVPWAPIGYTLGGIALLTAAGTGGTILRTRHTERTAAHAALADRWNQAVATHDTINTQYADLYLDTDAVLAHPALWDLTDPHTKTFTLALGAASDTRSLHPTPPTHSETVDTYYAQVEAAHDAWQAARNNTRTNAPASAPLALAAAVPAATRSVLSAARAILRPHKHHANA